MSKKIIILIIALVGLAIIGGLIYMYFQDKKKTTLTVGDTDISVPVTDPKAQNQAAISSAAGAGLNALITVLSNSQKPKNVAPREAATPS